MTRQIEYIAALSIPKVAFSQIEEIALRLEDSVNETISRHPAIAAYFVQPNSSLHEIHIGFRYEDVPDDGIEEWAEEVLAETIKHFKETAKLGRAMDLKREDTSLRIS